MLPEDKKQEFIELVKRCNAGTASPEEIKFLDEYYLLFDKRVNVPAFGDARQEELTDVKLFNRIHESIRNENTGKIRPMFRIRAAAVIAGLLITSALVYFILNRGTQKELSENTIVNDIAPAAGRPILTLANGTRIVLDDSASGMLAKQGNITVIKLDSSQLAFSGNGTGTETGYNRIETPRGSQYQIVLADGTRVWLNAASSLRFPVAFRGAERRVELTGEGYLEIAPDPAKPFFVNTARMQVQVLGTSFNIMAYDNEPTTNATLIEGAVNITGNGNSKTIKPGQQVQAGASGLELVNDADLEQVMAWKNGLFNFNKTAITSIMTQLERWYDVEVVYQGNKPASTFTGILNRNMNVSRLLKILEEGGVHCRLEGRKIIVQS